MRRQRDADAGVGRDLMAETLVGLADRFVDPLDQFHDVVRAPDAGLDDGELVAAQPGDEIASPGRRPRRRDATALSSSSPTGWPSESLTLLNSSMSI